MNDVTSDNVYQDSRPPAQHAYIGSMLPEQTIQNYGETLYIYAPLANRLGLNRIKTELEDLSFK